MPLQFSKDLDAHNPNTPEWREDVGLVVTRLLSKVRLGHQRHGFPCPPPPLPSGGHRKQMKTVYQRGLPSERKAAPLESPKACPGTRG